LLAAANWQCW